MSGRLIVFEGPDGVGKSTLADELRLALQQRGETCLLLAFPGKRPDTLGEFVYEIHHRQDNSIDPSAMQILHVAAHVDAIQGTIKPALEAGTTVILDRFYWSTIAYGLTAGVDEETLRLIIEVERRFWNGLIPDILFFIDREEPYRKDWDELTFATLRTKYHSIVEDCSEFKISTISNEGTVPSIVMQLLEKLDGTRPIAQTKDAEQPVLFSPDATERSRQFSENFLKKLHPLKPSPVFATYWYFAAERQRILFKRLDNENAPYTSDPILQMHRFTNAYRASDRVSQYLIKEVAYKGSQSPEELFLRVLLFKIFNKIDTWEFITRTFGPITVGSFNVDKLDKLFTEAKHEGAAIFSGAYIMPSRSGSLNSPRKHRNYLELLQMMLNDGLPGKIKKTDSLADLFDVLRDQPLFGDFLAFQFAIDLNYTNLTSHEESEFVVAGPGARSGIKKCFADRAGLSDEQIIRETCAVQQEAFNDLGLDFKDLFGRKLQLIDCQNLFCETDKYARHAHPLVAGIGDRTRIKQVYRQSSKPLTLWFPPKWGLNEKLPK